MANVGLTQRKHRGKNDLLILNVFYGAADRTPVDQLHDSTFTESVKSIRHCPRFISQRNKENFLSKLGDKVRFQLTLFLVPSGGGPSDNRQPDSEYAIPKNVQGDSSVRMATVALMRWSKGG